MEKKLLSPSAATRTLDTDTLPATDEQSDLSTERKMSYTLYSQHGPEMNKEMSDVDRAKAFGEHLIYF